MHKPVYTAFSCLNNMVLLHIAVLLQVVYKGECAQTNICSEHGLFPGIGRGCGTLSKGLMLYDVDPSTCDDGKRCKSIC